MFDLPEWLQRRPMLRLFGAIFDLQQEVKRMSDNLQSAIDQLRQDVAQQTSVTQSAVTLLNGIPALIQDAISKAQAAGATPDQMAALHELDASIQQQTQALAQAVSANTPANGGGGSSQPQPPAPGATDGSSGATNPPTPATTVDQTGQPTGPGSNDTTASG